MLKKSKNQDSIIITKFEGFINKIPFSIKAILKSLSFVVEGGGNVIIGLNVCHIGTLKHLWGINIANFQKLYSEYLNLENKY